MALANCNIDTLSRAAKCFDCLSLTEKEALKVYFMALAVKQAGGPDLTNVATLRKTVACFTCEPDFRLDSMEVAVWQSLATQFGATPPTDMATLRKQIACVPCGEQKSTRASWLYLLCNLAANILP